MGYDMMSWDGMMIYVMRYDDDENEDENAGDMK